MIVGKINKRAKILFKIFWIICFCVIFSRLAFKFFKYLSILFSVLSCCFSRQTRHLNNINNHKITRILLLFYYYYVYTRLKKFELHFLLNKIVYICWGHDENENPLASLTNINTNHYRSINEIEFFTSYVRISAFVSNINIFTLNCICFDIIHSCPNNFKLNKAMFFINQHALLYIRVFIKCKLKVVEYNLLIHDWLKSVGNFIYILYRMLSHYLI